MLIWSQKLGLAKTKTVVVENQGSIEEDDMLCRPVITAGMGDWG